MDDLYCCYMCKQDYPTSRLIYDGNSLQCYPCWFKELNSEQVVRAYSPVREIPERDLNPPESNNA